ncbi:MAG: shikimate kinase [Oscillospiraceae bacterium]|nr:shikimate kinase [Oscillospiraceae bacterium]
MMKTNLILIGMPGSGKSTVGILLAEALDYEFVDVDKVIEAQEGMALQDVLDTNGIDGFLKIEEQVGVRLAATRAVIAPGGSMALLEPAMEHLKQDGLCVFLDMSVAELQARMDNRNSRGIAAGADVTLEDILAIRLPYYQRYADVTVSCDGCSVEEIVAVICAKVAGRIVP